MAVKVDKEFLLKHRFWFLTGVFVVLALVPLFLLTTSVSAFVTTKQKEFDDAKKSIDSINSQSPNQKWVEDYQKQDDFVAAKKGQVHQEAWKSQADMMTYPDAMVPVMKDKRFGDPLGFLDLDKFARVYDSQLRDVVTEVQPLLPFQEGFQDGVVQFANNNIEGVLRLKVDFKDLPPTKEDFWLAEEDVWVKRELLRIIRDANDLVARFRPVDEIEAAAAEKKAADAKAAEAAKAANEGNPAEAKTPEGTAPAAKPAPKIVKKPVDLNHRSFRNQHWQLDLSLTPGKDTKNRPKITLAGSIKNVGSRKRALGIQFKVYLQEGPNASGVLLNADREPLAVGETWTFPPQDYSPEKIAFQGLFGVEEVLTWRTAPVKRIDVIELGYESSRLANRTLKPPRWYTPPVVETDPSATGGEGGAGLGGPGKFASMGMAMPGGGTGAQASLTSKNGLLLNRYIDSNDQVRHMPVGMVVVADDEHLSELLSAFTNSRLRIQVTQCHWQVFRDKIAPPSEETSPGGTGPAVGKSGMAGTTPGTTMGMRGSRGRRGEDEARGAMGNNMYRGGGAGKLSGLGGGTMLGSMGASGMKLPPGLGSKLGMGGLSMGGAGMPGGGSQFGASDGEAEENLNLLEVAIYGVASIYEKYPPKPITPPDATADAAAGQPKP
jgi:hypothetical protein